MEPFDRLRAGRFDRLRGCVRALFRDRYFAHSSRAFRFMELFGTLGAGPFDWLRAGGFWDRYRGDSCRTFRFLEPFDRLRAGFGGVFRSAGLNGGIEFVATYVGDAILR